MTNLIEEGTKRAITSWADVDIGMVVYLKYYGMPHAVLVTEKDRFKNMIRGIHYGLPGLFSTRVVMEEEFVVRIECGELQEYYIPRESMRSPEDIVGLGRNRIGEKKFNMVSRRSLHMILECVLKDH